ncbi:MAG: metallophosphoesterase [Myxococcales bacterium]|nr:MAG: metallophosphoesterase [Myxococcales bacterium]
MTRLFWTNFFSLLLVFVAIAQWVCATWLLRELGGVHVPAAAHLLGTLALYLINRLIVTRPMPPPGLARTLRRGYTGVAFTSLFGLLFLVVVGLVWAVAWTCATAVAMVVGAGLETGPVATTVRAFATAGLLGIAGAMAYGYTVGQRRLWINRFTVPIADLPADLDGLRVAQISDIHLGGFTAPHQVARYVERVNDLDADVVVITGDITDGLDHAAETFPVLGALRAKHGVLAILGNHDVYTGEAEVAEALRRYTGFTVLLDEVIEVAVGDSRSHVIGLRDQGLDWARGVADSPILTALHGRLPDGAIALLLSHRPDLFDHATRLGVPLMLSGHTHGGQVALPLGRGRVATLARFMTRFPRGTYRQVATTLHVNLGLGLTGQPVRLACPREITEITLTAA